MNRKTSEAEIRQLVSEGLNWTDAAKKLGVSVSMLRITACCLGIKSAVKKGWPNTDKISEKTRAQAIERLLSGETMKSSAIALGQSCNALRVNMRRHNLPATCRAAVIWKREQQEKI